MAACVAIDFIFIMNDRKILPLHQMKLSVVPDMEKIITGHILRSVNLCSLVRIYDIRYRCTQDNCSIAVDHCLASTNKKFYL